ncbi:MAG: archaeosortase/exosortase family protein [Nitrososphaerales archaeon]
MQISRSNAFLLALIAAFVAPVAIPRMGIDYAYFFIMVLVLFAWFTIKWSSVKSIARKGSAPEIILGIAIVAADYIQNFVFGSRLGLLDMLFIFCGVIVAFYGIRSFKLFWVPTTYGIVLLLGYQVEAVVPNFVALQNWMANVMAISMRGLGVSAIVSGHIVYLSSNSTVLGLNVEGDCTGVQGILAFGMLSTMAVLDIKAKVSRLIPLFVIGFVGAFLINIVRLFGVFLTFEYLGISLGTDVHVYLGYLLFIVWVMVFWSLAFRYLMPKTHAGGFAPGSTTTSLPVTKPPSSPL